MTIRSASAWLAAVLLIAPALAGAQTFVATKYDIKGDGGTDYVVAEPATHRVFVSRQTHVMVVDGASGRVIGDIPDTPGVHGIAFVPKAGRGFTTNGGNGTVTMFDAKTLAPLKQIMVGPGLDGIMYDEPDDLIVLTNHTRPSGTLTAINPATGAIVATVKLEDDSPEGAAADGKGHIFVNNEGKNSIQVVDVRTWKPIASWPLPGCDGPTGIAYDTPSNRIFSACNTTSVVVDAATGKTVATIKNGTGVDALGWDPAQKLIYIPNGTEGTVTVVHQEAPDRYRVVATVATVAGAKTVTVDPTTHTAYLFQPERRPVRAGAGTRSPSAGRATGPIVAGWFVAIRH